MSPAHSEIDVTICLSLPHRADPRASINYPSHLPPIELFDALEPKRNLFPGSIASLPCYYSTTLGHLRILELLWLRDDWMTALIIEDDALFLPFSENLNEFIQTLDEVRPDWLGAFLGWNLQRKATKITEQVYLSNGISQAHAYVIRRHGLWRLYDHLLSSQPDDIVDKAYSTLMENDSAFFIPPIQMITTTHLQQLKRR